jgi:hypothetical protein
MFKLDKSVMVFFAITVVSVGFVVLPLWNYSRFYLALWNFDYTLSSITVDTHQIDAIQINVSLLAMNPTEYSGLEVSSAQVSLQYFGAVHEVVVPVYPKGIQYVSTNWWDLKIGSATGTHPVGSNLNSTILITIVISPNSNNPAESNHAQEFINFVSDKTTTKIEWSLNCVLVLFSFLGGFDVARPPFSYVTNKISDVYWA